ncbi:hypothetical protein G9C85_18390 [Halorubellus sp. JP-L1]|uniref:hypothetical protein n=1 Tax=Halorubellus sp. JP-L1 TaxID=2715753 RepID=UPI00140BEB96|nr:hypothetical protein [Halorubellus sp. JP-L1]NHN43592.1 hypothetical protein [Halorubellus sp. JP-L1]
MVKKFTFLELHLDDARFSNAVGSTPEEAKELLADADAELTSDDGMDDETTDESSGRSPGRALAGMALLVVVALGVRTIARRLRSGDESPASMDAEDASVEVDLDEPVEA